MLRLFVSQGSVVVFFIFAVLLIPRISKLWLYFCLSAMLIIKSSFHFRRDTYTFTDDNQVRFLSFFSNMFHGKVDEK